MSKVLVYFAHPGQKDSRVNVRMAERAQQIEGITFVDLYAEYPRFQIDHIAEQERLVDHDVIVFQHPVHWYSTPALLKEFVDRVFDLGFAYGIEGDKLSGKRLLQAVTAGAPKEAYAETGYQNFPLRTFLTPMEQTAKLCQMTYLTPFVLYNVLAGNIEEHIHDHTEAYGTLLTALRDDTYDQAKAEKMDYVEAKDIAALSKG